MSPRRGLSSSAPTHSAKHLLATALGVSDAAISNATTTAGLRSDCAAGTAISAALVH
jgi:hypothetical protein